MAIRASSFTYPVVVHLIQRSSRPSTAPPSTSSPVMASMYVPGGSDHGHRRICQCG